MRRTPEAVKDETSDPGRGFQPKTAPAPATGKDAKLAAALRANLARRKAATKRISSPQTIRPTTQNEEP